VSAAEMVGQSFFMRFNTPEHTDHFMRPIRLIAHRDEGSIQFMIDKVLSGDAVGLGSSSSSKKP
jgi:hypothetical protein